MSEIYKASDKSAALALAHAGSLLLKAHQMPWQESDEPGFLLKPLLEDEGAKVRTWLMKVEPGAFSNLHAHEEYEQVYVLEGSFYDQDREYQAGDFILRAPGAMHTAGSKEGALMLLFYWRDLAAQSAKSM